MGKASDIKNEIKTLFSELLFTGGTPETGIIGEIIEDDFKVSNPFGRDIAKFPAIIINPPAIEGLVFDNARNVRTYTFNIGVMLKGEDVDGATQVEELAEALMNKLDKNPTLNGTCDSGVEPSITNPEPITSNGKTYIIFVITLKAKAIIAIY